MIDGNLFLQGSAALEGAKKVPEIGRFTTEAQAREAAEKFEAFFLSQMMQPMFANIDVEEPFGGGNAEKIWRSMMVDEYGKSMAKSGGIGIADTVYREILRAQEAQLS